MKSTAAINVRSSYDFHGRSAEVVQELLQRKQYIYPPMDAPVRLPVPDFEHMTYQGQGARFPTE